MGGSSVRQGARAPSPQFLEANVNSLIFIIAPPPDLLPLLIVPPQDCNAYSRLCTQQMVINVEREKLFIVGLKLSSFLTLC